jgi:hypothetical protein
MLEIKSLINKIKDTIGAISRQDQVKERISGMEDTIEEIFHSDNNKKK